MSRRKRYEEKKISKKTVFNRVFYYASVCCYSHRTEYAYLSHEEEPMTVSPYYKSVEIKDGDNLWNIARQYKKGSRMSTEEYIRELKRMNSLRSDTIHKGQFLTIVYYK